MGRIATIAIIALALGGATVESFAAEAVPPATQSAPQAQVSADARDHAAAGPLLADAAGPAGAPDGQMQPPPPPPGPMGMRDHGPGPGWGPGMPPPRFMEHMRHMEATWGLFFDHRDKNLSNADVQVLAQAILLVHGNHDWKVVNVADGDDGKVNFSFATTDGSVIARFAVDRQSGHLSRIG